MIKTTLTISIVPILVTISQIYLKKGLAKTGGINLGGFSEFIESFFRLFYEKYIYFGVFIAILGAFIWLIVISKKELTTAFPISSGIFFVILFIFSWIFLGENISFWKLGGTVLILSGIFLILK